MGGLRNGRRGPCCHRDLANVAGAAGFTARAAAQAACQASFLARRLKANVTRLPCLHGFAAPKALRHAVSSIAVGVEGDTHASAIQRLKCPKQIRQNSSWAAGTVECCLEGENYLPTKSPLALRIPNCSVSQRGKRLVKIGQKSVSIEIHERIFFEDFRNLLNQSLQY